MGLFFPSKKPSMPAAGSFPRRSHTPEPRKLGNFEGSITAHELEREVHADLRRHGMSPRKIAIVDATMHGSIEESGLQRGMNAGELREAMENLDTNAGKLGLDRRRDLGIIQDALEKRL
ncbi:MAG: hypothetical protein E6Q06_04245 [Candidatus Moraniibacteriota bacterium]|nr:MAG: hypothetical protein E6Q06_04245 [Candidatus Moranbacteria bacterium]